ncbi:hypothetical protein IAU60_006776 [Kwoniella sp. DSM 27419]
MNPVAGPSNYAMKRRNSENHGQEAMRGMGPARLGTAPRVTVEAANKVKRRRVPEDQRRRVESSCDRCKVRKIRCIRPKETDGKGPCAACAQGSFDCETTLPRKQRLYLSAEQLDQGYATALAILRKLYPERDLSTLDDLTQLATECEADVPASAGGVEPATTSTGAPGQELTLLDARSSLSCAARPPGNDGATWRIPEGRLLPAPMGGFHYVGPASSIYFAMTVRQLVGKTDLVSMAAADGDLFGRMIKAAEFTSFRVSQALEAKIEGHPATNAANDEETHSTEYTLPPFHNPPTGNSDGATPRSILRNGRWRSMLPTREVSDRLVQAFFDRVHPNFTLFHRGSFHMQYESIWSPSGETAAAIDPGWVCALMMVLVLGALTLETEGYAGAGAIQQQYLTIVLRDGLPRLSLMASVPNVQALMLLALYQHNAGERNTAWMLIGQAARTAVALGMHRDGDTANFDPIERNTRRTVWWVLYIFEQALSFVLGRPSATNIIDVTARLPDEDMTDGRDLPPEHFVYSSQLAELSIRVKRLSASISVGYDQPDLLARNTVAAERLRQQLDSWLEGLPPHLQPSAYFATKRHRRAVMLLHIHHDFVRSILGRPFLLCKVNHEIDHQAESHSSLPPSIAHLADMAVKAARSSMGHLRSLGSHKLLEGQVWLDLLYVHHATFILGLPYLSRTEKAAVGSTTQYQTHRKVVSEMLLICQRMVIAPTYRILLNIAMQFAYIVGMGPEETDVVSPLSTRSIHAPSGFTPQSDVHDSGQSHAQVTSDQSMYAWDQLFGPLPSRQSSPRGVFADLYNYGLDSEPNAEVSVPWDFFNLSALTSHDQAIPLDLTGENQAGVDLGVASIDPLDKLSSG